MSKTPQKTRYVEAVMIPQALSRLQKHEDRLSHLIQKVQDEQTEN